MSKTELRVDGGGLWLINRKPRANTNKLIAAEYELTEFGKGASLLLSFFQRPQGLNLFLYFSTLLIWTFFRLTHVHSLQNMAKSTSYSAYNLPFAALRSPVSAALPRPIKQTFVTSSRRS